MINNVVLVGRLTRDVDLRQTSSGTAVANFTVAMDRPFKSQNGDKETDFINCQAWRKTAEAIANFTKKGSLVGVQGRIQTRNYQNNEGQKVYVTEVIAENVKFLDTKNNSNTSEQTNSNVNTQNSYQAPSNQTNISQASSYGQTVDISDDDLPF